MNTFIHSFIRRLALPGLCSLCLTATSGEPSLKSSVIASGGRASRSADQRFSLTGTIGQAEVSTALRSAEGRFVIEPGFWHGVTVVQTPGGPELSIRRGFPGTLILAWPRSATGFVLEETSDLQTGMWKAPLVRVIDNDTEHTVTIPVGGTRCYRLRKR